MWSLAHLPFIALLLTGAPCAAPAPVDCSDATESCFVDVVEAFYEVEEARLGMGFRGHAAIYYLPKEHACFEEWRKLAETSLETETPVRVLFRVAGQEVVGLDPGADGSKAGDAEAGEPSSPGT